MTLLKKYLKRWCCAILKGQRLFWLTFFLFLTVNLLAVCFSFVALKIIIAIIFIINLHHWDLLATQRLLNIRPERWYKNGVCRRWIFERVGDLLRFDTNNVLKKKILLYFSEIEQIQENSVESKHYIKKLVSWKNFYFLNTIFIIIGKITRIYKNYLCNFGIF